MTKRKRLNPAAKITLGYLVVLLIGTLLLCLPVSSVDGKWFSFVDSLFTSTSAISVTGLVVVDTATHFSIFGQIVILLLIQIGGLGFITLTSLVFLIVGKKITYKSRVAIQESLNQENVQGMVKLVKKVIIFVFVVEFFGFLCLAPSFVSIYGWSGGLFKALFMSISAFCNSGMDVVGTNPLVMSSLSIFSQNVLVLLPLIFLIIIGGLGYVVIFDLCGIFKKRKMSLHSKVVIVLTGILLGGGVLLYAFLEWNNPATIGGKTIGEKIINVLFQSTTTRTAGFSTFDLGGLTTPSIVLTCFLMFIGGSPASTAGGIKTTTLLLLLLAIFKNTNTKGDIVFRKRKISNRVIQKCLRVVCSAILLVAISTFLICLFESGGVSVTQSCFESISAISTTGLSMGITSSLTIGSKLVLVLLMFTGRVGAVTLTVAIGNRNVGSVSDDISYPDSKIMVG